MLWTWSSTSFYNLKIERKYISKTQIGFLWVNDSCFATHPYLGGFVAFFILWFLFFYKFSSIKGAENMQKLFDEAKRVPDELKKKIFDAAENEFPYLLEQIKGVIAVNSINPNHAEGKLPEAAGGEEKTSRLIAEYMKEAGMEIDLFGEEGRLNAVGTLGSGERSLLFNGHVDVVDVGDSEEWTVSPWSGEIIDGKMYGRGTTDMKAGLMCTVGAVKALTSIGLKPDGKLIIQAVCGEEGGEKELGTEACLKRGYTADAGICVEASAPPDPLAVLPASPGVLPFEIWVEGKAAHTSMRDEICRAGGHGDEWAVSALDKIVFVYTGLLKLEERWGITKTHPAFTRPGHFTINPCGIYSGPTTYAINSEANLFYTAWFSPKDTVEDVKKEITDYVTNWCSSDPWLVEHPPVFKWLNEWPGYDVPLDAPICHTMQDAYAEVMDKPAPVNGFVAVSDASFLNAWGIPTVIMGPGNIRTAHGIDECVAVQELLDATKIYALAIVKWLGLQDVN